MAGKIDVAKADFVREIVKMAAEDEEFRAQLIADPKRAVKAGIGFEFPPGSEVKVLEESANSTYIVLPAVQGEELGDGALEQVAGGTMFSQFRPPARSGFATRFGAEGVGVAEGGGLRIGEAEGLGSVKPR